MARLTDLSPELVAQILDLSDWPAYLQMALSCRYLAHCSQRIMARHRRAHALYKATSDISPETLPTLCRALLKNPVDVSHVFALEFWGQRVSWDEWKPYGVQFPGHVREEGSGGLEAQGEGDGRFLLKKYELDALERIMHDEIRLCVEDCKIWREKIERGDDGALKGMLIALCPNLQAVRFVKYAEPGSETGDEDENEEEEEGELYRHHQSCLDFLVAAISAQHEFSWSPGLASLSRIAVGVPSRATAALRSPRHRIFSEQALPLFRLPNLQSLYLNGLTLTQDQLNGEADEDVDFSDTLPPSSSPSLRELVIEDANLAGYGDAVVELIETMMGASDALLHMAFQDGCVTGFSLEHILPNDDSKMQSLLFYGAVEVQGYRSQMYYPEYLNTPAFTVDISDVMLCAPATDGNGGPGNGLDPEVDAVGTWGTSRSQFGEYLFDMFADRWKAIVFVGDPSQAEAEMVDEGLVRFIKSVERGWLYEEGEEEEDDNDDEEESSEDANDANDNGESPEEQHSEGSAADADEANDGDIVHAPCYPSAIYLEGIDNTSLSTSRWYAKAIQAGKEAGIQVHTRTTPAPRHHGFPFPRPASDEELQTSPLYGTPEVEGYLLKPHLGLVVDSCGNCGACGKCLEIMDGAAWEAAWEAAREDADADASLE